MLKIVIRSLWKNKLFSAINVLSLTLCLSSVMILLLLISKLVTFDDFHIFGDRLYGLEEGNRQNPLSPGTVFPVAERLKADFPEVERYTRTLTWDSYLLEHGQGSWSVTPDFVDADFLEMFTFPLLYGNSLTALQEPNSIVLSQAMALRIFGDTNPVGKEIAWNDSLRLTVTGVLKKIPGASSLQFTALMPMQWLYQHTPSFKYMADTWENRFVTSYILLKEGADQAAFDKKLSQAALRYYPNKADEPQLGLILFKDITPRYEPQLPYYIGGLRLIVCFLVLLAGANLINLTSATAYYRIREIGVRHVLGSSKTQILSLFLSETASITAVSLAISLALVQPIINYFNKEILTEFSVDFRWGLDYPVIVQVGVIFILLALISAWIPAKRLLRTPIALSLKGQATRLPKKSMLQQSLVVVQFALATLFVFLTLIIQQQLFHIKHHDLGFNKDQVLVVDTYLGFKDRQKAYQTLDHVVKGLTQFPDLQHVTTSQNIPGQYRQWFNTLVSDSKEVYNRVSYDVDSAYFPTYGIRFLAGTNFYDKNALTQRNAVILNRTAAEQFGWTPDQAIGQHIHPKDGEQEDYTVIGVTEDFYYRALNASIEPLIHFGSNDGGGTILANMPQFISIRIAPSKAKPVIQYLRSAFAALPATGNFSYSYSNEIFDRQYEREDMVMTLIGTAGAVAIFIACAGTFGLTAQLAHMRTKEVGIRKVLGASITHILTLLSARFVLLVGLALIIALPLGYWAASLWLQEFPVRIAISWSMSVIAALSVLSIAITTISIQALKAARSNPVDSLRNE